MFKCFCLGLLALIYSFGVYAQDVKLDDKERMEKGNQIIGIARKEIGVESLLANLTSFRLSTKSTSNLGGREIEDAKEISFLLPDKIFFSSSVTQPFEGKTTTIWNEGKYKKLSETVTPDGQRVVRDITNQDSAGGLERVLKNNEKLEMFKKVLTANPKEKLSSELWSVVFPLILINPFETKTEFKYAGKAESANREANIVDTTSESGHSIRLLFDSKTSQLLVMTEKFKGFDGDYENNYYYSNREKVDGVLIPKKIKVEHKFTPTGKVPNVTFAYIDVVEFKINPKFKPNLFDIN